MYNRDFDRGYRQDYQSGAAVLAPAHDLVNQEAIRRFFTAVYLWMTWGLVLTGVVAWYVSGNEALVGLIYGNKTVFWGLLIVQLAAVFGSSWAASRASAGVATALFLGYAMLKGLTLSAIFLVYDLGTIGQVFFVTAGSFFGLSMFGMVTRKDLSGIGTFCYMALIGIILASVANWFMQSEGLSWFITYAGVLIFAGLTAWDTQKLKLIALSRAEQLASGGEMHRELKAAAVGGALALYLDFLLLFIYLLRILGGRN